MTKDVKNEVTLVIVVVLVALSIVAIAGFVDIVHIFRETFDGNSLWERKISI